MCSHFARRAIGSAKSFSAYRYELNGANNSSPSKAAVISKIFPGSMQRRGRAGLAESPRNESYEAVTSSTDEEITSSESAVNQPFAQERITPFYHRGTLFDRVPYWQKISRWKDVTEEQFLSHSWNVTNVIQGRHNLFKFLNEVLPDRLPQSEKYKRIATRQALVEDVVQGVKESTMQIRLTPHILSMIDWTNPLEDPLWREFIPTKSSFLPDHPKLTLDSLHEKEDSPVNGLVHRYPEKVLFLATSVCGFYCRYCTRSYAVGGDTDTVTKTPVKPSKGRWEEMFAYIESNPVIQDVVVSGGDAYTLLPHQLRLIGDRLLSIPHIRRFRIATKGLCVSPSRSLDHNDCWTDELIRLSRKGREMGKEVALHTHFNHPQEFSWVTREAAQKLYAAAVVVRCQTVLLKGVNDDSKTMNALTRELADNNIEAYYAYQCDLVRGIEDLRTPLQTILDLEKSLRGTIGGSKVPQFVVDLPGGGGKRLAASYETYDRKTGVSTFVAPAITGKGKEDKVYGYYDPLAFCESEGEREVGRRAAGKA